VQRCGTQHAQENKRCNDREKLQDNASHTIGFAPVLPGAGSRVPLALEAHVHAVGGQLELEADIGRD
jgi:hypothetical protein